MPHLHIVSEAGAHQALPEMLFDLKIPPVLPVMSALVFSVFIGLAATWKRTEKMIAALNEFQGRVILIVTRIIIPILPFFIACIWKNVFFIYICNNGYNENLIGASI